ncbi:MAG: hypothetical protein WCO84_05725 [bacterium]
MFKKNFDRNIFHYENSYCKLKKVWHTIFISTRINPLRNNNESQLDFRSSFELNYMICGRLIGAYFGGGISSWDNYSFDQEHGIKEVYLDFSCGISKFITKKTNLSFGIGIIDSELDSYDLFANSRLSNNLEIIYGGSLTWNKIGAHVGIGYSF